MTDEPTYKIVRFYQDENHPENKKVINTGFTLEQAKRHCQDSKSKAANGSWFDGFVQEETEESS